MAVIRETSLAAAPVMISLKDADDERARILAAARAAADRIRATAHAEGYEAGFKQGVKKGREDGLAQSERKVRQSIAAVTAAVESVDALHHETASHLTKQLIELAIALAQRITKRQAAIDPQVAAANFEQAARLVAGATQLRIALNPQDLATIQRCVDLFHLPSAQLIEDPNIAPGGCRIHTEHGVIDADINTQLDRLTQQLLP
jgi:flagellar assembly protein FliH